MKQRPLGNTGISVSEIGFGAWAIGGSGYGPTKDEDSLAALQAAWESGVTFYDTADTYGHGHSEELVAKFLKQKPRDQFVLASKVGWDFYHGGNRKNFDPDYIRFAIEKSLGRLGLEHIDVYQLHNPKLDLIRSGEALEALARLKKEGKIRFVGISVHTEEEALAAIDDDRVDTLQLVFNLMDQKMARRVFPKAQEKGVGVIVREPLACGLLSGKYKSGHEFVKEDHRRRWMKEKLDLDLMKYEKIKQILATNRLSTIRAALEFALDFDAVSVAIPGAKTPEQVLENVKASLDPQLRIEESSHLRDLYERDEIFKKVTL